MTRSIRAAAIAAAILLATLLAASSAYATGTGPVSVNTASTLGTSTNIVLSVNTARLGTQRVTCASFMIRKNITTSGAVTIPAGFVTTLSCRLGAIGVTISQPIAWTGTFRHLDDAAGNVRTFTLDLTLPAGSLSFSGPGCTFTAGGLVLGDSAPASPVRHNTLVTFAAAGFPASLVSNSLTLILSNVSGIGCGALGVANGNTASLAAIIAYSPGINMAGI